MEEEEAHHNGSSDEEAAAGIMEEEEELLPIDYDGEEEAAEEEDLEHEEEEHSSASSSSLSSSDEDAELPEGAERESFDTDLPTRHSYLGASNEVGGRVILEEGMPHELVTFSHPGVMLMPGQTMPLTLFRPQHIALMRRLIDSVKTFGSLYARLPSSSSSSAYEEALVGTTAEIFEYRDPPEDGDEVGFKVKVRGRQRFRVISSRTQIDGTRVATVRILPESRLQDPFHSVRLGCTDRLRQVRASELEREVEKDEGEGEAGLGGEENSADAVDTSVLARKRKNSFRETLSGLLSPFRRRRRRKSPGSSSPPPENKEELTPHRSPYKMSRFNNLRTHVYRAPLSAHPNWVYEMYDARILVERVHDILGTLRLFSHARVSVPSDPEDLSFWVACNLPIDDGDRYALLELNSAVQRLRYELGLLRKFQILCCRRCNEEIATQDDIFSMSQEGPQSAYVNPGGYVHETLTLYSARRLYLVGSPSTEFSWFPGYSWTIAQCRGCHSHMGWKFTACDKKLHPKKFWGISRQNIRPLLHAGAAAGAATETRAAAEAGRGTSDADADADGGEETQEENLRMVY